MNSSPSWWALIGVLIASVGLNVLLAAAPADSQPQRPLACGTSCDLSSPSAALPAECLPRVQELSATCCKTMAPLQDSIQEKFAQLRTLLTATQVDEEQVRATSEELSQLRSRSLQECVDCLIQLRQMLTPAELDALWECCAPTTSE